MKWLVQTLDQLVSNRTDPESSSEQKRLEELIGRYKNLIPTIELTMVKTDIFSKCYTYRKEVCSLLQKVKESSAAAVHPDSMELVQQLIKQQETALGQLDEQRPNIMSMLQRGKDLSRDSSAPDFVKSEVTCLESNWNDAYAQTAEKLKKLRGTQKVWNQYREQKDEIVALLEQADAELRKMIPSNDLRQIAADLQTKQNLSVALREATEEMLKKLRDLCAALAAVVPPKKPVLEKEVTEIERRLQVVLETVHERVVYLESFQARWTKFSCQLGELRAWCQTAPTLLDQLAAPDMSPAERVNKAHTLQAQLQDKTRLLNALAAEARELFLDQRERTSIDRFMKETGERWKSVSMELRCVQSMLEEVINYWKRWNTASAEFESWLERAYSMMDLPDEERMEFFQDLSVWKERYQTLGDTVTFLIATCDDPIVVELKDRYTRISSRWEELFPHVKQYMHAGDILRNRKDYRAGVEQLQNWLRNAETTLASSQISSTQTIKAYGENISRKFQSLIPDLSREEVDRMMLTLKKEKEALVRVRALVPMQLHLFHQILVQHESLEAGQIEIGQWLDEADNFLATHTITADREQMQAQLDKHKVFFSRTLYYKSMLESKNKVYHSIMKSLMSSEGIDTSGFKMKMEELNERFIRVTHHAQLWEQKLLECLRCWENFRTAEKVITEWLHKAEQLISEKHIDNRQTAQRLKSEVLALQEEVQAIQRAVELQCSAVGRDLANWQTYQAGLQQVRPWIEQAEVKVAMGVAKPASLQEATEQLHNAKTFESECETKLAQLQETAAKSQQMTCQTNAHDEVDALHSRWTSVHGQALNWSNRLEQLVASWGEFNQLEKQLADWLQAKEAEVQAPVNLNSPDVAKLEQQLAQLKVFFFFADRISTW
ncbi:hypothetical protein B566_EDAN017473 [Ephemera danica]|nr:hypothetical protein B566_EDAN017473 [Ephemera danica]